MVETITSGPTAREIKGKRSDTNRTEDMAFRELIPAKKAFEKVRRSSLLNTLF
jgi:hypothetical protein